MPRLADMLAALEGNTDEFKMLAVNHFVDRSVERVYVQPSEHTAWLRGEIHVLTIRRMPVFPFITPVEFVP